MVRRRALGLDVGGALNLVGRLVKYLSGAFAFPVAVGLGYGDPVWPFLAAGAITFAFGLGLERVTSGGEGIRVREGFLVVALTWALAALAVSLPYLLDEPQLANPLDAYFEAMSGMTTTGATVLTDLTTLDHTMALWRQFTQWLGGMGIVVLGLAVLPRLRVGGRQLVESEMPGPEYEPLASSIRQTARRLWLLYVGLTGLMILVLSVFGWTGIDPLMSPFQAAAHAFTTLPTGGFSPQPRSAEPFAAASQWVMAAFMAIAGANFALHYRALRRRVNPLRDEELRLYLVFLAAGSLIVFLELLRADLFSAGEEAVRHSVFQVVSMMTTTGYASADFAQWTTLTSLTLVFLMLIGGCAGSTGGAMKVVRHLLIGKLLLRELDQTVHREAVLPVRLNGRIVDERTLRAILAFGLIYVGLFIVGSLVLTVESARAGLEVTALEAIGATATTLGNVGPSFGFAGPMGSFEPFSPFAKGVMILLMWAGRLEIVPVAVLLTRRYWRA
ncbi:MAG: TrkH family potassium uptake protein [Thermoleophilia bacterium]|nr:TrkH family potassium uptake protein [Thermoleophilia bacterium]